MAAGERGAALQRVNDWRVSLHTAQPGIYATCPSCGSPRFVPASTNELVVLRCRGVTPAGGRCNHPLKARIWRNLEKPVETQRTVLDALWGWPRRE